MLLRFCRTKRTPRLRLDRPPSRAVSGIQTWVLTTERVEVPQDKREGNQKMRQRQLDG